MATVSPIDIQKALKGMDYPAKKQDIIKHAQDHGADKEVMDALNSLPDKSFETPADVNEEIANYK